MTSAFSDSTYTGSPSVHDVGYPSTTTPSLQHQSVSDPSRPYVNVRSGSLLQSPSTAGSDDPPVLMNSLESLKPKSLSIASEAQLECVTVLAIVAILVQLLTSSSNKTAHAVFSVSIILELLGILFTICIVQMHNANDGHHSQPLSTFTARMPTVLILAGIVGLGAGLVIETLETSLATAVAMSSFLISGVILCLLTLVRGFQKVDDRNGNGAEQI